MRNSTNQFEVYWGIPDGWEEGLKRDSGFVLETKSEETSAETTTITRGTRCGNLDHLLRALKLPAPGLQFGGRHPK
jgi:hypothetical protein